MTICFADRMICARQARAGTTCEARQTYDEWLATGEPFDRNAGAEEEE